MSAIAGTSIVAITALVLSPSVASAAVADAERAAPSLSAASSEAVANVLDTVTFGDSASEAAHGFAGEGTQVLQGVNGQPARAATPFAPNRDYDHDLTVTMTVDPARQNYFSLKLFGEDASPLSTQIFVDGEQVGFRNQGDLEAINTGTSGGLPKQFYFDTTTLPLTSTQGRTQVQIIVRTFAALGGTASAWSRPYYQAFTHLQPTLGISAADQLGNATTTQAAAALPSDQEQAKIDTFRQTQVDKFNSLGAASDASPDAKMDINRYSEDLQFYAQALTQPWSPAKTDAEKKLALQRIFKSIDNYTKQYYGNVKSVANFGHQTDWGGYYSNIGETLYTIEPLIKNSKVLGSKEFKKLLAEPFTTGTVDGDNSIAGVDWNGGQLSRGEAWERMLKASFDFSRSRLSYIYNQMYFTYIGSWQSQVGLEVIGSSFYEGPARSKQIILEALGVKPFLGEEVLVGPDGQQLNLYHDLFKHDAEAEFTPDVVKYVMRGLAKSETKNGQVVRRVPYGTQYTGITEAGLTRENGYVGLYGEAANDVVKFFYLTAEHGDAAISNQLLQLALRSIHARAQTKFSGVDANGYRGMFTDQVLDDRSPGFPGRLAYGIEASKGLSMMYASLEKYMADHAKNFTGSDWKTYWEYARDAVGYQQQQLVDNQYFNTFDSSVLPNWRYDMNLPDTWKYVTATRADYKRFSAVAAGRVLPRTDFSRYTDVELAELGVGRNDETKQFAWVDLDDLMFEVRDGSSNLAFELNRRNRGLTEVGKAHAEYGSYAQFGLVKTTEVAQSQEFSLRAASLEDPSVYDRYTSADPRLSANTGELIPIAYQPGVGTSHRENWNYDNPYSGYPDLISARYGEYFLAANTTRSAYKNSQTFELALPDGYAGKAVQDLVTGKNVKVKNGKVTVPAHTAMVLKVGDLPAKASVPAAVTAVVATPAATQVGISWRPSDGASSYRVERATSKAGTYAVLADSATGNSFVDNTAKKGTKYWYRVTALNAVGSAAASPAAATSTTQGNATSGTVTVDQIGDVSARNIKLTDSTVKLGTVNGGAFGAGNDNIEQERYQPDAIVTATKLAKGSAEVTAKVTNGQAGVILRESLDAAGRYVYLGANGDGQLVLRTRSLDTRSSIGQGHPGDTTTPGGILMTPLATPIEGSSITKTPYLRLIRDADSQQVTALASSDGATWQRVGSTITPMLDIVHAGIGALTGASAEELSVTELPAEAIPTVSQTTDTASVQWNKPKNAIAFDLYRTDDPSKVATDPRADGGSWTKLVDNTYTLNATDSVRTGVAAYKVVSHYADGSTSVGEDAAVAPSETIETVLARAKAQKADGFTQGSYYTFQKEVARIEDALAKPEADKDQLKLDLYNAFGKLVASPGSTAALDVLKVAKITTAADSSNHSVPKNKIGESAFDGVTGQGNPQSLVNGAWIQADFGSSPVALVAARAFPESARSDTRLRLEGAQIQGSNDGTTWTTLGAFTGIDPSVNKWYEVSITDKTPYRYVRYLGADGSYGSVSELQYVVNYVDRSLVDVLLHEADGLKQSDWSDASWAALQAAVGDAKSLDANADQATVDKASAALRAAITGLETR